MQGLVACLINNFEGDKISTAILPDFNEAFDCLDHSQLMNKMKTIGICETSANLFKSYLARRL